ncbi:response regulator transcription factor [Methylobacterium sp. Leaf87]|uniref:LuxR C-terminal-related transcriptional regulator n=1 Tax=Methylobacterium sp. Leaf87 TaxID=1736243 RepID=UPI0009E74561|nr:response regulator transcription factor [Methylobacterium sp. Leaf87]
MSNIDIVRAGLSSGQNFKFESHLNRHHTLPSENDLTAAGVVLANAIGNTIILIDRRPLVGQCLLASLRTTDKISTFELYPSLDQWKSEVSRLAACLVVFCLPGHQAADADLAAISHDLAELGAWNETIPTMVMSDSESPETIVKILQLGVKGYIPTTSSLDVAVQALHLVRAGGVYVPAACMLNALANASAKPQPVRADDEAFSPRQMSVARALRKGTPNKIIAYELNMCESTVKVHVRNIMKKLKAKNRTEVAYLTNKYFTNE